MSDSDRPNLIQNDDLDDLKNQSAPYPHTTPAGYPDPQAAAANELLRLRSEMAKLNNPRPAKFSLTYDKSESTIHIGSSKIELKPFSKEAMLCDVVLENEEASHRNWSPDEVVEKWPVNDPNDKSYPQRNASDAADRINKRFLLAGLPQLFTPPTGSNIKVSPVYL